MNKWIAGGIAIVGPLAALMVWVGGIAGEAADTKRRLATVESRQEEDRKNVKESVQRIESRVEKVDENVQQILRKMDVIEDRRRADQGRGR